MSKKGLFVGLVTLDLIYLAQSPPKNNEKIVAVDYTVAAGGPATNAAVAFSYLGNQAKILGVMGSHPMTQLIRSDLEKYQVEIIDLDSTTENAPPVSSIIVTQGTGERAVISINAVKTQVQIPLPSPPPQLRIANCELRIVSPTPLNIVLVDGHQMAVGLSIVQSAKAENIPVVIDGGSWKSGFDKLLPFVDYAICSDNFFPPNCQTSEDVFDYLSNFGIPYIAVTHGEKPIQYLTQKVSPKQIKTVNVPLIQAVDTLGAGDIFHGAFCHYILQESFPDALSKAAEVASNSCQYFGTRKWMD
ncbi:MAG: sugar kinase [Scytonematopsis contorta HA4267-MV1]|jgi:sugar/nucleoside kinase (ribokinase family)|nr:sugar kinase [Scytonematopsis contorta HA4267-MV1]